MMVVERKYHFYAAHRNRHAGEKCARIHGHTYRANCHFGFKAQSVEGGITMLFSDIDALVEPIIKDHCHRFLLYDGDPLRPALDLAEEDYLPLPFETSAENLALWLATRIKNETNLPLVRIELSETDSSTVIYIPDLP